MLDTAVNEEILLPQTPPESRPNKLPQDSHPDTWLICLHRINAFQNRSLKHMNATSTLRFKSPNHLAPLSKRWPIPTLLMHREIR